MKKILFSIACFLIYESQAMEYEKQFENDQICIAKVKVQAYEEIPLHRDLYPQIVIALKGGTITRLEADGSEKAIHFPTGVSVFREADPENELHKSVNYSSESVELIIIQLKESAPILKQRNENSHDVEIGIKINCPMSEELKEFVKSIPASGEYSSTFEEWKNSFTSNMTQLINLVESEKVFNASWSVKTDDNLKQEANNN